MTSYLKQQLRETLEVVDTCLECIYQGKTHMYRALAGQLRLLLCDTQRGTDNSLLAVVYPRLRVSSVQTISWSHETAGALRMTQRPKGTNRIAQMPLEISVYSNGLAIADLLVHKDQLILVSDWSDQRLTFHPARLTARAVIRAVADRGGGAHVDSKASPELRLMYQRTPAGRTYAELFVVGMGRFAQALGEQLFKYKGCRVPQTLTSQSHERYNLLVVAHRDFADS